MHILVVNYEYPPLGGGGGFVTRDIARLTKGTVIAIDGSSHLVDVAKKILKEHPNTKLGIADGQHLPFVDNTFDIVTCNLTLMWADDPKKVVRNEITNAVATAGILLTSGTAIAIKQQKDE